MKLYLAISISEMFGMRDWQKVTKWPSRYRCSRGSKGSARVLVSASRRNRLFLKRDLSGCVAREKFAMAKHHRQTRETRALPRIGASGGRAVSTAHTPRMRRVRLVDTRALRRRNAVSR